MSLETEIKQGYIIDAEGTSTWANTSRLLSLAIIEFEYSGSYFSAPKNAREFFFMQFSEIPSSATNVNNLTLEILQERSQGKTLEDQLEELLPYILNPVPIIGHNVGYDIGVVRNQVLNAGGPKCVWDTKWDTLSISRNKYPTTAVPNHKLGTLFNRMLQERGHTREMYEKQFARLFPDKEAVAHSASWDAYMTYMLFKHLHTK